MKTLLLSLIFISSNAFACQNFIPASEAAKAVAGVPDAGSKTCKDLPNEQCLCFDGIDWETTDLVDHTDPIIGRYNVTFCKEDDNTLNADLPKCSDLMAQASFCDTPSLPKKEAGDVYCEKVIGQTDPVKILVPNDSKKAAKQAKLKSQKDQDDANAKAKADRQAQIKALAEKQGNLTATEIQQLLKAVAQEAEK